LGTPLQPDRGGVPAGCQPDGEVLAYREPD
jgi:hypothetical protein